MTEEYLEDIVEVDMDTQTNQINKKLKDGWVLLATAPGTDEQGYPIIYYSIGRKGKRENL